MTGNDQQGAGRQRPRQVLYISSLGVCCSVKAGSDGGGCCLRQLRRKYVSEHVGETSTRRLGGNVWLLQGRWSNGG